MNSSRRVRNLETLARRIRPRADWHDYDKDDWLDQFERITKVATPRTNPITRSRWIAIVRRWPRRCGKREIVLGR